MSSNIAYQGEGETYTCEDAQKWITDDAERRNPRKGLLPRLFMAKFIEELKFKVAAMSDGSTECPESFIAWEGSCYLQEATLETWQSGDQKAAFCKSKGAHLPTIHSEKENRFISFLYGIEGWRSERKNLPRGINVQEYAQLELGGIVGLRRKSGTDPAPGFKSENWEWADGSEITYTNWSPGEPSNHGEEGRGSGREPHWENWAVMESGEESDGGRWIDSGGTGGIFNVCEIDKTLTISSESDDPTTSISPVSIASSCFSPSFVGIMALAMLLPMY